MGKHSKPSTHSTTGPILAAAIATSGAFAAVTPGVAQATAVRQSEGPPGGWDAVVRCESNFNPQAHNRSSSAAGLFQFLSGTWRSLGGLAFGRTAADATPEQQIEIANRAYERDGLSPWEASRSCWRRSGLSGSDRVQALTGGRVVAAGRHRAVPRSVPLLQRLRYVIRRGDTLSQIAVAHGHTWQDVFAENRAVLRDPNLLRVGLTINI